MSRRELPDQVSPDLGAALSWLEPHAAAAISALVDQGTAGVAVVDTEGRVLLVSDGLAALHGREASESVGKRADEVFPAPYGERVGMRIGEVLASGAPVVDAEIWGAVPDPGGARSFTSSFSRLADASGAALGVVVLVSETTGLRSAATAITSAWAQIELLQQITEALSGSLGVAEVAGVALIGAMRVLDASAAALFALEPRGARLVSLAAGGQPDPILVALQEPTSLDAHLPHCDALASQKMVLWGSGSDRDIEYPELARYRSHHRAWAFVPMVAKDRSIGVAVFAWHLEGVFSDSDVSLLDAAGRQCALALEQARILEAEREGRRAMEFLVEVTRFVVESSDEGVYAMSTGNRILTFNRRFCELMGLAESALEVGRDASELLAHCAALAVDPDVVARHLFECRARPFDPLSVEFELRDGRVMACSSSPIVDRRNVALGRVWYMRDETERRVQEVEQRVMLEQLQASHEHQSFLLQAAEIVSQADGYSDTLERLAAAAVPTLADLCLVDTLTWDGRIERMAAKHADPSLQPLVDELESSYAPDPAGAHPSVEVMHTGRARWSATMTDEFLHQTTRDERHFALLKRLGFTSYMAVPLVADNRILGSITLVSAGSGRRFGPADLALADDFTSCVAQVVAAAYRNDAARRAAQTLQASLLPDHVPEVPGFEIAVRYLPATLDNDVGGDFYDVITGSSHVVTLVIGDVAGHDMQAAAVMGKVRTAVRVLANQATGPRHFMEMLRHGWDNLELERIATLLIATVDPRGGELRIVSAGHPPPLLIAREEAVFLDVKPTTPLGAPVAPIHEWRGTLAEGTALLLYTDGLIEDRHRRFEEGSRQLARAAIGRFEPDELCNSALEAMVRDAMDHNDDIALMAVTRSGPALSP